MRNALAVVMLVPAMAAKLAGVLLGLGLVPLGILTQYLSLEDVDRQHWPDLLWLWGNDEDGVNPEWWQARHPSWPHWWQAFVWLAIRNPFNNFRYLFKDVKPAELDVYKSNWPRGVGMEPGALYQAILDGRHKGRVAYRFVRKGWKCGYRRIWLKKNDGGKHYSEFWIGWKLASGVPGLGLTLQLRLNRKTGT